jgi:hypothetical protein
MAVEEGDADEWVPCEHCEDMIRFSDYAEHARVCVGSVEEDWDEDWDTYIPNGVSHRGLVTVNQRVTSRSAASQYEEFARLSELLGVVEVGVGDLSSVTKEDLTACPGCTCTICLESLAVGSPTLTTLCKHTFCKPCLSRWFACHKKCPLCMSDMDDLLTNHKQISPIVK